MKKKKKLNRVYGVDPLVEIWKTFTSDYTPMSR